VGSEVFATVNMKIMVLCYVIPRNVINRYQSLPLSALKMETAGSSAFGAHLPNSTTINSRRS